jgi:hypothetical protein
LIPREACLECDSAGAAIADPADSVTVAAIATALTHVRMFALISELPSEPTGPIT